MPDTLRRDSYELEEQSDGRLRLVDPVALGRAVDDLAATFPADYRADAFRARLQALAEAGLRDAELLVVTHVDRDHIEGVLALLQDAACPVKFKEVWFNGYDHLDEESPPSFGAVQGERLTGLLASSGRWNRAFAGRAVSIENAPTPVGLAGGLTLRVLSPSRKKLRTLLHDWELECRNAELIPGEPTSFAEPLSLESFGSVDVAALAAAPFRQDTAPANGSSIALLLEWQGRRVLLGADAHPELLCKTLTPYAVNGRVALDAIKVPHHGSKGNLSPDLVKLVDCPQWLISTNGNYFKHPDDEAIARIIVGATAPELIFNYSSPQNKVWDDDALRAEYQYTTRYLRPGEAAVCLEARSGPPSGGSPSR